MAYIGNLPATGQNNSFRLLDDITSYTLTFDGSSASVVNSSDKTIESANHRFVQGQRVVYTPGGTPVANLTGGTAYFIIKQGGSHFQLATSATNASNGVAISISAAGSSTSHTLVASFDAINTRFMASHSGGTKVNITRSAQLNISINGVIQEPQETASPTAGFGRDSGSVIVFSTAPNAGDAFWGSLVADNVPTFDISDNDVDNFTGDDSTTDFTLSKTPPDPRNILVTLDGVTQHPSDNTTTRAYTVTENILSFTSAPNTSVSIQVRHIGFAGATSGSAGVSAFYGRTGSVVLKNTDTINVANIVDEGYLAVGSTASFGGNVSIGGTLTYDDVTYVEAVGLSTFHEGIRVIGVSTFTDSVRVGGHAVLSGTPHDYNYGRGSQDGGLSVYAREAAIEVVGDDDGGHGGSVLIRTPTEGFGFVINPSTNSLELKAFTTTGNNFSIHNAGQNVSNLNTQLRVGLTSAVELSFNGNKKFETIGYGVTVVGSMQVSGITTFFNATTIVNGGYHRGIINSGAQAKIIGGYISGTDTLRLGESLYLTTTGLGIGSITPGQDLHIYNSGYAGQIFQSQRTDYYDNIGGPLFYDHTGAVKAKVQSNVGGDLKFNSGGTDNRMVIVSSGQVGLGITNPEDYFSSYNRVVMGRTNDTGGMTIVSSSTSGGYISFAKGTSGNQAYRGLIAYQHNGDYMTFNTDSGERLRIVGAGITVTGEVAASQDYPITRPTLNFNFTSHKKLDPRITYQRTGPASYYDEFGKVVLVGDNAPRFDHDPVTRESKGLLIEESRTNQLIFSSDITDNGSQNSGYSITNGTVTGDQTTAPDGTTTADQFAANSTNNIHRVSIYFTSGQISNSTAYTFSVFVKANGYDKLHIRYGGYNADNHGLGYDLSDGTTFAGKFDGTGSLDAVTSSSMIAYPNGWYRCSFTFTTASDAATGSAGIFYYISNSESTTSFAGDGSSGMHFWGAQMEVGAFLTSYIPTNGAIVTRGMENVTITDDDFTDFYNPIESTAVCEFDTSNWITYNNNKYERIFSFGNHNTETDTFEVFKQNSSNSEVRYRVRTANSNVMGAANYSYGTNTTPKVAFALKLNDTAVTVDGGTPAGTSDTSIPMPTVTKLSLGNSGLENNSGVHTLTGHIRKFMYYPVKLPDSQVVTLTS